MNHLLRGWKGKSLICCLFCERKNRSMQKPSTFTATLHTQQILMCSLGLILDTHLMFPQQLYSVKFKMKLDFLIWTQDGSYNLFKIHIVTLCIFIVHDIKLEMAISFWICCWDDARCQVAISEQDQLNILDSSQFTRKKVQHLYSCKFTARRLSAYSLHHWSYDATQLFSFQFKPKYNLTVVNIFTQR